MLVPIGFCIFAVKMFLLCEGFTYRNNAHTNSLHFVPASDYGQCTGKSALPPTYTTVREIDTADCAFLCSERRNCAHFVTCAHTRFCYLEDDSGSDTCGPGCASCTCFYNTVFTNVALNAECQSSSQYSTAYSCSAALDGRLAVRSQIHAWASRSEGVGAWIKVSFDKPRTLFLAHVMQRWSTVERSKDILFEFSDGSSQSFTLPYVDRNGAFWDRLALQPVTTLSVKITIISVYTKVNNGFAEIELMSPVTDDSFTYSSAECP